IRSIVDEARALGCQRWAISGGEPMLREDFSEIFDVLTRKSVTYTLNTNGTLITPEIARLMKRKGSKMVVLYGATSEVHDRITRNPGSFEAFMRGLAYLKEAGAGFMIQVIPMRSNWHQYEQMVQLAESLSSSYRIGSAWLFFSACGSKQKNREIEKERLSPEQVLSLDPPSPGFESFIKDESCDTVSGSLPSKDDRIFKACISSRRNFHIDAYGGMSFCSYVKDPALRYDLKQGTVQYAWETFIPSLAEQVRGGEEYIQNCGSCENRRDCRWCGVYAYLEHRRFSAPITYLCDIAKAAASYKTEWKKSHRRFYQIAGITIQLDSDLPITESTFSSKFKLFEKKEKGSDIVRLRLHFHIPDLKGKDLGQEVYRKPPLAIYRHRNAWIYLGISTDPTDPSLHRVVVFTRDHNRAEIYIDKTELYLQGGFQALTLFASDQILLARILAERQGFSIHSAGMAIGGKGLLFIGRSGAGKSTTVTLLKDEGEILCDENIIVRGWAEGFRIHGTWSHGDVPEVSNTEARLRALFFLEKSYENRLEPITEKREVIRRLLPCLLKPLATSDWWEKILSTVEKLVREVPAYRMKFDTSGEIRNVIHDWLKKPGT
ncbi:MAG: radical SAM protein, partial [Candidatus Aminicenantes bacterium]|nr:radical SAM protein [Candidatus Aminicenantes bacterium]